MPRITVVTGAASGIGLALATRLRERGERVIGVDLHGTAVDFVLGPDARFMCGSVVFVDGGTDALLRADDWPAAFG